jgi:hypothetical protein
MPNRKERGPAGYVEIDYAELVHVEKTSYLAANFT